MNDENLIKAALESIKGWDYEIESHDDLNYYLKVDVLGALRLEIHFEYSDYSFDPPHREHYGEPWLYEDVEAAVDLGNREIKSSIIYHGDRVVGVLTDTTGPFFEALGREVDEIAITTIAEAKASEAEDAKHGY